MRDFEIGTHKSMGPPTFMPRLMFLQLSEAINNYLKYSLTTQIHTRISLTSLIFRELQSFY